MMHTNQNKLSGEMTEKCHVRKYQVSVLYSSFKHEKFLRAKQQ